MTSKRAALFAAGLCLASRMRVGGASSIRMTECPADGPAATYRWVNSGEYLYVEGAGSCVTLSDIYQNADDPPLVPMTAAGEEVTTETG